MTIAAGAHHEFFVTGSPVSVNRYGTPVYKNWRGDVHAESVKGAAWSGCLVSTPCSVHIRYFQHLDARKDVDNILKAILDGLDGKAGKGPKLPMRVIHDDRDVERVISQRTKIGFTTRISSRSLTVQEYAAALAALSAQAAVFVSVGAAPSHSRSVLR
jgi:Holliday junction resolvase RusA-like endonuclease